MLNIINFVPIAPLKEEKKMIKSSMKLHDKSYISQSQNYLL